MIAQVAPTGHDSPTLGFDTVFAVSLQGINDAIRQSGKFPPKLSWPQQGPFQFGLNADFDPWQMVTSGDQQEVHFALPMRNVRAPYVYKGTPDTVTCDALTAYISIKLDLDKHTGPALLPDGTTLGPPPPGTTRHALKVNLVSTNNKDPIVSLVSVDYSKPLSEPEAQGNIETMILNWATVHLKDFEHVFAFADLNDQVATGAFAFCKPVTSTYAYSDSEDGKSGQLALLSMTSADPMPGIPQLTSFAIPDGCDAAFLISRKRFMIDMMVPGLLKMWPNLTRDDLIVSDDFKRMHLKANTRIDLPKIKTKDGDEYVPSLHFFTVEIDGAEIEIHTYTEVKVEWGVYATCDSTCRYKVGTGTNSKGQQTLTFVRVDTNTPKKGYYTTKGRKILNTVLTVVAVVLTVLALLLDGVGAIIVGVALAALLIGRYADSNHVSNHVDDAPGFDDLFGALSHPVTWNGKHLTLTTPGLNGALRLGGLFH